MQALRMLPRLDHRWHTVTAKSDISVVDTENRTQVRTVYIGFVVIARQFVAPLTAPITERFGPE